MIKNNWEYLKKHILSTDLYSRSGIEAGVSQNTITLNEVEGDYIPVKTKKGDVPQDVILANPDLYANYPELNKFTFNKEPDNWLIGNYKKIFIGFHKEKQVRRNGASAGIVSGIQLYLLNKKLIDGAVVLRMNIKKPYLTEPIIAKSKDEILDAAQSKYTIAPVNQILSDLPGIHQSICYTGLPHEIVSVRKLQKAKHISVSKISYTLGLFYGETIGFSAIKSLVRAHRIKNLNKITKLAFREGEWPGNMVIKLKNGRVIKIPKLHANYLIPSHITPFSLYQVDYMSELADISVGDAWAPKYEERGKGWSVVVARNNKGMDLLSKMERDNKIWLKEISVKELINMHSHGLDLKKRGAFIRINNRKKKGLPIPDYGYFPTNIPKQRILFEYILGILFKIFQSPITIRILEVLPTSFLGWFFIKARNYWKKFTKTTKKGGLSNLKFKIDSNYANSFTIKQVRDFWGSVAEIYEPANKNVGYVHTQRFEKAIEYFKPKTGMKILNIWSRTGKLIPYLRKVDKLIIHSYEASPKMINIAKTNYPTEAFNLTDLKKLKNVKDNYYDAIYSLETLEHTPNPLLYLNELSRVLKKNGVLVMSLPPAGFEIPTRIYDKFFNNHGEGPHRFLNPEEVQFLLIKSGFKITKNDPYFVLPLKIDFLTRLSEKILTAIFKNTPLNKFALRYFYVAKKE